MIDHLAEYHSKIVSKYEVKGKTQYEWMTLKLEEQSEKESLLLKLVTYVS